MNLSPRVLSQSSFTLWKPMPIVTTIYEYYDDNIELLESNFELLKDFKEVFKIDLEEPAVNKITWPVLERAAKNESKSEYLNRMNKKIDAIVDSVRELHESNSGMWELKYNPDAINFNYGDLERKNNDV